MYWLLSSCACCFFLNDTSTSGIYTYCHTLSLHDARPIYRNALFDVRDKTVIVTGGSRGIGEMIARAFIDHGAKVIISSRNAAACEALAAELSERGQCRALPFDLATANGIAGMGEAIDAENGGLNVLINNAGATWGAPLDAFPDRGWDKTTNLKDRKR